MTTFRTPEEEIRFACLELAASAVRDESFDRGADIVDAARRFYAFVTKGAVESSLRKVAQEDAEAAVDRRDASLTPAVCMVFR